MAMIQIPLEFEGDFCGPCNYYYTTKNRDYCFIFDHVGLDAVEIDLDFHPIYDLVPPGHSPELVREPVRCLDCRTLIPSVGIWRLAREGAILYPSVEDFLRGTILRLASIQDFCDLTEDPNLGIGVKYQFNKNEGSYGLVSWVGSDSAAKSGTVVSLGKTTQLQLKAVPKALRETLFRWLNEIQHDIFESENQRIYSIYVQRNKP